MAFFDHVKGVDDFILTPTEQSSELEDVKESVIQVHCGEEQHPILFRIRKAITEKTVIGKTRAHINIELNDDIITQLNTLDEYIQTVVYKHHASPHLFNQEFPEEDIRKLYTSCISSNNDDDTYKYLRVRTEFQSKQPHVSVYEDIDNKETMKNVTTLEDYLEREGEYIICLTSIRFLKTTYKCEFVLKAIDIETRTEEHSHIAGEDTYEKPLVSSFNLAELIMRNNNRKSADVETDVATVVDGVSDTAETAEHVVPSDLQIRRNGNTLSNQKEKQSLLKRQQKYITQLQTLQKSVAQDVEIALQKKQTIESDYTHAMESLSLLQNSVTHRTNDGYTTDDEMIRQDAEDEMTQAFNY
jgi:hypothetical protein